MIKEKININGKKIPTTDQVVNIQQSGNIVHALLNWTPGNLSNYPIVSLEP